MPHGCLDHRLLSEVAAGRCPKERLAEVQRHLAVCKRCRGAVVAKATGIRGPGDTVLMRRPPPPRSHGALKFLAVAVSLLAVGGAWVFTALPKPTATLRALTVQVKAALQP